MLARGWPCLPRDTGITRIYRHREKTAEERFNMLARGRLAYPVTPESHASTAEERLYMLTRDESKNLIH